MPRTGAQTHLRSGEARLAGLALTGLVALGLIAFFGRPDDGDPTTDAVPVVGTDCAVVERRVENVPEVDNPFDPEQADVRVELTGPRGRTTSVPAFVGRRYERRLDGRIERLDPAGDLGWWFRVTPTPPGEWTWRATVTTPDGSREVDAGRFTCDADPTSRGVLEVSPDDPRYLRWSDGSPFVALGGNLAWADEGGTHSYDRWLDRVAGSGGTIVRVWMAPWGFGLEGVERADDGTLVRHDLGDYRDRLDRAWALDQVIQKAHRLGLVVVLSLQEHGEFVATGPNTRWASSAYNADNGGPLAKPIDIWTDPVAKELFARRLRYVISRWGYAPNVMWELWNEADLTDYPDPESVAAWHKEMIDLLRSFNPRSPLVTTSLNGDGVQDVTSGGEKWMPLWSLPEIDVVQLHPYGAPPNFIDFTRATLEMFKTARAMYGKPVLIGETSVDFRGPEQTLAADPSLQSIHEQNWGAVFGGTAGGGLWWWWDSVIDPLDGYRHLEGLAALLDGVRMDTENFRLRGATAARGDGSRLQARPLNGRDTVLVWIRNGADWWHEPNDTAISDGTLRLETVREGQWRVRWFDTRTGQATEEGTIDVTDGTATLPIPLFVKDTALRLERIG